MQSIKRCHKYSSASFPKSIFAKYGLADKLLVVEPDLPFLRTYVIDYSY